MKKCPFLALQKRTHLDDCNDTHMYVSIQVSFTVAYPIQVNPNSQLRETLEYHT